MAIEDQKDFELSLLSSLGSCVAEKAYQVGVIEYLMSFTIIELMNCGA